jgi:hypothetical protein
MHPLGMEVLCELPLLSRNNASGPLQGTDGEVGGDVALHVGDAGHGAGGVDGEVVDALAILIDPAFRLAC